MRDTFDMFEQPDRGRFGDNEVQHGPGRGPKLTGAFDLVDVTLRLMKDNPLSIAVVDPAKFGKVPWTFLPKSQIEYVMKDATTVEVSMPHWLAREKELI